MHYFLSKGALFRLSAWILIQALICSQALPAGAWALPPAEGREHLRVGQTESRGGLEELEKQLKPAGLEEPRTLPQAINRWFKADAAAREEQALEDWLAARGEERIRRFVERVIDQVEGLADPRQFGAFEVPAFDPAAIPAPGQRSGSYPIPSSIEEFERERVRMMAHVAVRRAFGHLRGKPIRVVANVGIGYVGTAVTIVTADAEGIIHLDQAVLASAGLEEKVPGAGVAATEETGEVERVLSFIQPGYRLTAAGTALVRESLGGHLAINLAARRLMQTSDMDGAVPDEAQAHHILIRSWMAAAYRLSDFESELFTRRALEEDFGTTTFLREFRTPQVRAETRERSLELERTARQLAQLAKPAPVQSPVADFIDLAVEFVQTQNLQTRTLDYPPNRLFPMAALAILASPRFARLTDPQLAAAILAVIYKEYGPIAVSDPEKDLWEGERFQEAVTQALALYRTVDLPQELVRPVLEPFISGFDSRSMTDDQLRKVANLAAVGGKIVLDVVRRTLGPSAGTDAVIERHLEGYFENSLAAFILYSLNQIQYESDVKVPVWHERLFDEYRRTPRSATESGLEEIPPAADPLSSGYAPGRYVVSSPAAVPPVGEVTLPFADADPLRIRGAVQKGERVVLRTQLDRVGERLWDKQDNAQKLQLLYKLVYDLAEKEQPLGVEALRRVIDGLNSPVQAVAAAARDVIVKARVHGVAWTVRDLVRAYQERQKTDPLGPYAAHYFRDALTTRLDLTHKMELGSPETPLFAGEMTDERIREIQTQLERLVNPKSRLAQLTGSGQRLAAPIDLVDAGFQQGGFPTQELMVDIGSQPHDVVKVLFALVAKLYAENMPVWRAEFGRNDAEKQMPAEWTVAIGMDPRSTGPAIFQTAARIFRQMGIGVKFIGVTGAPEAAARTLLADPSENLLGAFEITPSHIAQGFQGTKLMLWTGQILPWARAEKFNEQIIEASKDFSQVRQVIEWLQDESLNAEIDRILQEMPAEYAVSKAKYHQYIKQLFTGSSKTGAELDAEVGALSAELKRLGVTIVLDANGGAGIADLPVFDEVFGGYVVIGANAAEFAHSLPPGEISAQALMELGARIAPAFDEKQLCCLWVNPDPDRDRKGIVYREPGGTFLYLDPQAGYLLDVLNHVLSAREAQIPGVGVVANEATTVVVSTLAKRLGFDFLVSETGEASVVAAMNRLKAQLLAKHGADPSQVTVMGGEGSAAATIAGEVQVRDMIQGVVSMMNFLRKPERVRELINLLVDDEREKTRLLGQVDSWYRPGQLQYLIYHLVHEILPAMRNTDTGFDTEIHQGVGIANQKPFKDTADRLLAPDGTWINRIRRETAEVLGVPEDRIRISEPINSIEDYQLPGAGRRTLPDGRTIHDGGYELQVFYRDASETEHYLYKLEFRRSKTQIGDTRRLVFNAVGFLPRDAAEELAGRLYDRTRSLWLGFLNDLEVEELMGHVEGSYGLPHLSTLEELSASLDRLLGTTRQARAVRVERLTDPKKKTYSRTDTENIAEQDAAAEGAIDWLSQRLSGISPAVERLSNLAGAIRQSGTVSSDQTAALRRELQGIQNEFSASLWNSSQDRNAFSRTAAQDLVGKSLLWKVNRLLGDLGSASAQEVPARVDRLTALLKDLRPFAALGPASRNPKDGVVFSNLVNAKILLSGEADYAQAAEAKSGLEEHLFWISAGVRTAQHLVILTPETARAGLEALSAVRPPTGEGPLQVAVVARDAAQEREIAAGLEEAGLVLALPIVRQEGRPLADLILDIEMWAWAKSLQTYVVNTLQDLFGIAPFLKFVPASVRAWTNRVEQITTGISA